MNVQHLPNPGGRAPRAVAWRGRKAVAAGLFAVLATSGCGSGPPPQATPSVAGEGGATAEPRGEIRDLGAAEAYAFLQTNPNAFVLDVRLPPEWDDDLGHLDFAAMIPMQELELRLAELPSDKARPILVYDRTGLRSTQAAEILAKNGYREIYTILGGLESYRRAGY
jgi:rhodanese-related sulfurtransferase